MIHPASLAATLSLLRLMMGGDTAQTHCGTGAETNRAMSRPKTSDPDSLSLESSFFEASGRALAVRYTTRHTGKFDSRRDCLYPCLSRLGALRRGSLLRQWRIAVDNALRNGDETLLAYCREIQIVNMESG